MQHYKKYYKYLKNIQNIFETVLQQIDSQGLTDENKKLAKEALIYATHNNCGYFTSSILENFYLKWAKALDFNKYHDNYTKNSFLHVLSKGYTFGGHTRVTERWIEYAPKTQKHSALLLYDCEQLPKLQENVEAKGGQYIKFNNEMNTEEKATKLREIAQNYEYIVLHTHMDDPIATIAFGVEEFKRPVILYNHASHLFWIGKSIADIVADLLEDDEVTQKRRNIKNIFPIGIPSKELSIEEYDKNEYKRKLNLPINKKIIVTSGSAFKYDPIGDDNFYDLVKDLIDEDTYLYVIVPTPKAKQWKKYAKLSNNHIITLGTLDFHNGYLDWIRAADLFIDSFPVGSWTAGMDTIINNTPLISHDLMPPIDYVKKTRGYVKTKSDFIKTAKKVLNDKEFAQALLKEEQEVLLSMQSKETWNKNIEELLKKVPRQHTVKDLTDEQDFKEIDDFCILANISLRNMIKIKKVIKRVFFCIKFILYKLLNRKYQMLKYLIKLSS